MAVAHSCRRALAICTYKEGAAGWLATGLENQRCVTARGSTPSPSAIFVVCSDYWVPNLAPDFRKILLGLLSSLIQHQSVRTGLGDRCGVR